MRDTPTMAMRFILLLATAHAIVVTPPVGARTLGTLTISVGFSVVMPRDVPNAEAIVAQADEALYAAKRAGRDRACEAPGAPGFQSASG